MSVSVYKLRPPMVSFPDRCPQRRTGSRASTKRLGGLRGLGSVTCKERQNSLSTLAILFHSRDRLLLCQQIISVEVFTSKQVQECIPIFYSCLDWICRHRLSIGLTCQKNIKCVFTNNGFCSFLDDSTLSTGINQLTCSSSGAAGEFSSPGSTLCADSYSVSVLPPWNRSST